MKLIMEKWTKAENLAIYLFLESYPNDDAHVLAERLKQSEWMNKRTENAIYQHICQLKNLEDKLYVPDPVHEFNQKSK